MGTATLDHRSLYRLPWNLPDNGISWLEPTSACNLACDGCYRKNERDSHKPYDEVLRELDLFQRLRKADCISIAGGDPLLYPRIADLVAEIRRRGLKPIVNTNGVALSAELLGDLKKAGVFGFTFHVDSRQGRAGPWRGKNEVELNDLRLQYAEMLARAGNIACSFNSTVYDENLQFVPGMVAWAQRHIDIVHTMVFICFRHVIPEMPFDWFAGGTRVDWDRIWYHSDVRREVEIKSSHVVGKIRELLPDFEPAAYLNGTEDPSALKWLLAERLGTSSETYGYPGPKFVELLMGIYHFARGRYLSYVSPRALRRGRSALLLLWPFDRGVRRAALRYLGSVLRSPLRLFRRVHLQSIMVIQPVDFQANGGQSMCDGCPDITVHDGRLVWSCRLEELKQFGTFVRCVPKA
jgi:hypothetical protein